MKKFIIGFVLGALIFSASTAYAATQFTAHIANFKVLVNGEEFKATTGEVLTVEGRTYLPLRDMGNALGVSVVWNEKLRQVEIGTPPDAQESAEKKPIFSHTVSYEGYKKLLRLDSETGNKLSEPYNETHIMMGEEVPLGPPFYHYHFILMCDTDANGFSQEWELFKSTNYAKYRELLIKEYSEFAPYNTVIIMVYDQKGLVLNPRQ